MTKRPNVLVVDDKENIVSLLATILEPEFAVTCAEDGQRALALVASEDFDVVLTDIKMPGADGLTVLRETRLRHPETEVILMTSFGSIQDAVEAMKQGAYDYISKPFDPDEPLLAVRRAAERRELRQQARDLKTALEGSYRFENFVTKSQSMRRLVELMQRAAHSEATVLISGESGTGKEIVARAIHRGGPRSERKFVPINCGAIPEPLLESELFGHVRGAFTGATADRRGLFEEADGGTLFLDELGELPLTMQVKLNRALQERAVRRVGALSERPIDVRVIAATNVDLKAAVAAEHFREDLYYRLNVLSIHLPPLRERREDIAALAAFFLERHGRASHRSAGFSAEALAALVDHDWPGNVRELENVVLRALAVSDSPRIDVKALPEELGSGVPHRNTSLQIEQMTYRDMLAQARDRATRDYLVALMKDLRGSVTEAAERAGIERESMHRLLKRHRIRSEDFKSKP